MTNPFFSIVIPVYNTAPYLRECLDSVLAQTYVDFEALLVDDGSTDESGSICDEYSSKDSRIKVIHQQNQGVSAARNTALEISRGEYIGFVDSDDTCLPGMLSHYYELIKTNGADIVQSEGPVIGNNSGAEQKCLMLDREKAMTEFFKIGKVRPSLWLGVFKKELFQDVKFPQKIKHWEDFAIIAILVSRVSSVCITNQKFYIYRQRSGSATSLPLNENQMSSLSIYDFLESYGVYRNMQDRANVKSMFISGVTRSFVLFSPIDRYRDQIKNEIRKNISYILRSDSIDFNKKCTMLMFLLFESFTIFCSKKYHNYCLNKYGSKDV